VSRNEFVQTQSRSSVYAEIRGKYVFPETKNAGMGEEMPMSA